MTENVVVALLDTPPDADRPKNALEQGIGAETTSQSPLDEDFEVTEIPLRSIHAVTGYIPAIESARTKISSEMEIMVLTGLGSLVCDLILYCSRLLTKAIVNRIVRCSPRARASHQSRA